MRTVFLEDKEKGAGGEGSKEILHLPWSFLSIQL